MSSPLGNVIQPTATAGTGTQQSFVNALSGATMSNGQLQGVPTYQGQLTPDLSGSLMNQLVGQYSNQNQSYNPSAGMGGAANAPGPNASGYGGYNANNANMSVPWMTNGANQYSPNGYNMANGQSPSSILGATAMGYGAGASVDTTPAWQAMVGAQQQNVQTGADQLANQFNNGGGLFSTAYGGAQAQYQSNARAQQNAQLTQGQLQAQTAAQGIQANAANQLGQYQLGNAQVGANLGQQQLTAQQNALTAQYQNWFSGQAQNNPLLAMMYSQANAYNPSPFQTNGWLAPVMAGIKGASGAAAGGD